MSTHHWRSLLTLPLLLAVLASCSSPAESRPTPSPTKARRLRRDGDHDRKQDQLRLVGVYQLSTQSWSASTVRRSSPTTATEASRRTRCMSGRSPRALSPL